MLKTILKRLQPTTQPTQHDRPTVDIAALEAALEAAKARRADLLLDGEIDDVLAAERAVDVARIELERGHIMAAELARRQAEAEAKAAEDAMRARYAEVKEAVDTAVASIQAEYPGLAARIAELAAIAAKADAAAREWNRDCFGDGRYGLPLVDEVAAGVGWAAKYMVNVEFAAGPVLPELGDFDGLNCAWPTKVWHHAVYGHSGPAEVRQPHYTVPIGEPAPVVHHYS